MFGRDEVGMLAHRQEGEARLLGQVVPVVAFGAEWLRERQDHHHRAHRFEGVELRQVRGGQGGRQARHQARRSRREHGVVIARAAGRVQREAAGLGRGNLPHGGAEVQRRAALLHGGCQRVEEGLEAAHEGAQARGARVNARPHPRHVDVGIVLAELADQQRFPQRFVHARPHVLAQPLLGGHLLQGVPVGTELECRPASPNRITSAGGKCRSKKSGMLVNIESKGWNWPS